jgi:hypothetical protein
MRWTERFSIPIDRPERLKILYKNRNGQEIRSDNGSGEDSE